jgi:hypothetical protein
MRQIKFLVDSRRADGMFIGRNSDLDIPIGTIFTRVGKVRVDGPPSALQDIDLGTFAVVKLTLQEVEFYRCKIDLVPAGHSAGIRLSGEGVEELVEALNTKLDREYVHLRT